MIGCIQNLAESDYKNIIRANLLELRTGFSRGAELKTNQIYTITFLYNSPLIIKYKRKIYDINKRLKKSQNLNINLRIHVQTFISVSRSVLSNSLPPHGLQPTSFLHPRNSPGKDIGMGCHFLLQGNLPNLGIEPRSSTLQTGSLPPEHQGSTQTFIKKFAKVSQRI